MKAVELLRELNQTGTRKVPDDAPRGFVRPRWERHVFTNEGIDQRFYETCVLSELGKSLRSGDLSVTGSRRYRDFDDYLLPAQTYSAMRTAGLPLAIELDAEKYLSERSELLHAEFLRVDRPPHRRALHRHRRFHRSRLRLVSSAWFSVRSTYSQPRRHAPLYRGEAIYLWHVRAAHRWGYK